MIEIKDIVFEKGKQTKVEWDKLLANIFDDEREFCAISFDSEWCCTGIIVDYLDNIDNKNPCLQINDIFKNIKIE